MVELRDKERPDKAIILSIIRCGIYGEIKCKCTKKVMKTVDRCFQFYEDIDR